jgi:hypothetical protein
VPSSLYVPGRHLLPHSFSFITRQSVPHGSSSLFVGTIEEHQSSKKKKEGKEKINIYHTYTEVKEYEIPSLGHINRGRGYSLFVEIS